MTTMIQFEIIKKGAEVYALKDNKIIKGVISDVKIENIYYGKLRYTYFINTTTDRGVTCDFVWEMQGEKKLFFSKEELLASL